MVVNELLSVEDCHAMVPEFPTSVKVALAPVLTFPPPLIEPATGAELTMTAPETELKSDPFDEVAKQ